MHISFKKKLFPRFTHMGAVTIYREANYPRTVLYSNERFVKMSKYDRVRKHMCIYTRNMCSAVNVASSLYSNTSKIKV